MHSTAFLFSMAIHNAESGDIVWLNIGTGPRARILYRKHPKQTWREYQTRYIFYRVVVLDNQAPYSKGEVLNARGASMKRKPYVRKTN